MFAFSGFHWLVVAIVVFVLFKTLVRIGRTAEEKNAPALRRSGKYVREVVGEASYQPALKQVVDGRDVNAEGFECMAVIVPESDNRYDANAVAVKIDGRVVGYLPRDEARLFRARLKRAKLPLQAYECPAKIIGGGRKHYGVWLDLPDRLT